MAHPSGVAFGWVKSSVNPNCFPSVVLRSSARMLLSDSLTVMVGGLLSGGERLWAPGWRRVFPLIVRQLGNLAAVGAHHEQLAVGLRTGVVENPLIFETFAGTAEHQPVPLRRPDDVGVVAVTVGQFANVGAIRPHGVDVKIPVARAAKRDTITAWRPNWKCVIILGQLGGLEAVQGQDAQALFSVAHYAIDQLFAVGRPTGEPTTSRAIGQPAKASSAT